VIGKEEVPPNRRTERRGGGLPYTRGVLGRTLRTSSVTEVVVCRALSRSVARRLSGKTRRGPGTAAVSVPRSRGRPGRREHRHHVLGTHLLDLAGEFPRLRLAQASCSLVKGLVTAARTPGARQLAEPWAWMIRRPRPPIDPADLQQVAWLSLAEAGSSRRCAARTLPPGFGMPPDALITDAMCLREGPIGGPALGGVGVTCSPVL